MRTPVSGLLVAAAVFAALVLFITSSAGADTIHTNEVINANATWSASGGDHVVVGALTVNSGVTLTIADGCVVKFDHGAHATIHGALSALGTSGGGIVFTRRDADDQWGGLWFYWGDASGSFTHCTFEYGTYGTGYGIYATGAASLSVQDCMIRDNDYGIYTEGMMPEVGNCTIRDNQWGLYVKSADPADLSVPNTFQDNQYAGVTFHACTNPSISNQSITGHLDTRGALLMDNTGEFHIGTGNSITGNSWGLTMTLGSYPDASSAGNIPLLGNTHTDGIQVWGGSTSSSVLWRDLGVDFIVTVNPTVNAAGTLTVADGVTVKFENGQHLTFHGTLSALGTSGDGIVFTRRDADDQWGGLWFYWGDASGSFTHCTFEYGTYGTGYGIYATGAASLSVQDCMIRNNDHGIYTEGMMLDVGNCTIRDNQWGLYVKSADPADLSVPNTFQDNQYAGVTFHACTNPSISNQSITGHLDTRGALLMDNTGEFHIGTGNSITGNSWGLTMTLGSYPDASSAGNIPLLGNTHTDGIQVWGGSTSSSVLWRDLGVDFIVTVNPTVNAAGTLTVADGVTVKFENGQHLTFHGTLSALGTSGDGIVFTRRDADDQWGGLWFYWGDASGSFTHCTFEYGTYGTGYGIYATGAASLSVQDCMIRDNDYGIYTEGMMPEVGNCTIRDNQWGLYVKSADPADLSVPNTFQDNQYAGVTFHACTNPSISNQSITGHLDTRGALLMDNTGEFHIGTGNSITGNSWGLTMTLGSYPDASSAGNIPLLGNTHTDGIQVWGGSTSSSVLWRDLGVDFIVTVNPTVNAAGTLTVADGVTVKFENGQHLTFHGTLSALGTSGDGIVFTRRDADDQWGGLWFYWGDASGSFTHCTFEYGTYGTGYGIYATGAASLSVQDCMIRNNDHGIYTEGMMLDVGNCTIRDNQWGLYVKSADPADLSVPNTFQDNQYAGVTFHACTNPSISNQSITGHLDTRGALLMDNTGEFHIGTGNSITGNSWGLTMTLGSYPDASSAGNIPLSGNTHTDGIQVWGGSTSSSIWWRDLGVDFIVTATPTVNAAGTLTVADGVTVKFENGQHLTFHGTLSALGTSGDGIVFTRRDADDQWGGLWFYWGDASGSFTHCTFEYGTYGTGYGIYANGVASLSVQDCMIRNNDHGIYTEGMMPDLGNCTIRDNQWGLYVKSAGPADLSVPNTFQDNQYAGVTFHACTNPSISNQSISGHPDTRGALLMDNTGEFHIGTGNSITGNSWGLTMTLGSYPDAGSAGNIPLSGNTHTDGIQVWGGSTSSSIWWRDLGVDFIVTATPTVNAAGTLTVADGVTVKFENGQHLTFHGTLSALGTSGDGIVFTRRDADDQWGGLWFYWGDASGSFTHCTFEYGTYGTGYGIYATGAASLSVQDCTLLNNDYGIYASNTSPSFVKCEITDNTTYGIYLDGASTPTFGSNLSEWNDIHGNGSGNEDRDLRNGTEDISAAYVYWGTLNGTQIESLIHHEPDDAALGLVNFSPWTRAAHDTTYSGAPISVETDALPAMFALSQNEPNPFNPLTTIRYDLPRASRVTLLVYDLSGRLVRTLRQNVEEDAGYREAVWNALDDQGQAVASGIYLYCLTAGDYVETRRMAVIR